VFFLLVVVSIRSLSLPSAEGPTPLLLQFKVVLLIVEPLDPRPCGEVPTRSPFRWWFAGELAWLLRGEGG
jgi:hypothetical protein